MRIKALKCPECGDLVFSRARHDWRSCSCNNYFVDGGFDYCRYGGTDLEKIIFVDVEIDTTIRELYQDWDSDDDKFGLIKME